VAEVDEGIRPWAGQLHGLLFFLQQLNGLLRAQHIVFPRRQMQRQRGELAPATRPADG